MESKILIYGLIAVCEQKIRFKISWPSKGRGGGKLRGDWLVNINVKKSNTFKAQNTVHHLILTTE